MMIADTADLGPSGNAIGTPLAELTGGDAVAAFAGAARDPSNDAKAAETMQRRVAAGAAPRGEALTPTGVHD